MGSNLVEEEKDAATAATQLHTFLDRRGKASQEVVLLVTAEQHDKERDRVVRGGGWDCPKASFKP